MWSGEGVAEMEEGQVAGGGETEACEFCFGESASLAVPLSLEAVGLVQKFLLLPPKGGEGEDEEEERSGSPWLCEDCASSLTDLTDLFFHLEDIRREFNGLRRQLGRRLILRQQGQSQEVVEQWEERLKGVEHLFPSSLTNQPIGGEEKNPELRMMPPLKRMEPLKKPVCGGLEKKVEEAEDQPMTMETDSADDDNVNVDVEAPASATDDDKEIEVIWIDDTDSDQEDEDNEEEEDVAVDVARVEVPKTPKGPPFPCSTCGRVLSSKHGLLNHIRYIHNAREGEGRHECAECPSSFVRKSDLVYHVRRIHEKITSKKKKPRGARLRCPSCPKVYFTRGGLRRHRRINH